MKTFSRKVKFAGLALVAASSVAAAAVTFDPESGAGFVGKGDVQYSFGGKNNHWLQQVAANVEFRAKTVDVIERSWDCVKIVVTGNGNVNEMIQERERTEVTTTQGLIDSVARERNQITGFILKSWDGEPTETVSNQGPPLMSCPNASSTFVEGSLTEVVTEGADALEVSADAGGSWQPLLEAPKL